MEIKRYSKADETLLFDMLVDEGDDWSAYHGSTGRDKYIKALESSINYIACDKDLICGFVRCRDDDGFGVYSEGSFIRDFEKNEIYYSSEWRKRLGIEHLSPREATLVPITLVHPEDRKSVQRAFLQACENRAASLL